MSDVLQRMIARTRAPLSPVEPILRSIFAPASYAPDIEVETVAPAAGRPSDVALSPTEEELRRPRPVEEEGPPGQLVKGRIPPGRQAQPARVSENGEVNVQPGPKQEPVRPIHHLAPEAAKQNMASSNTEKPPATGHIDVEPTSSPSQLSREHRFELRTDRGPRVTRETQVPQRETSPIFREISQPAQILPARTEVFISIGHIEVRSAPPVQPPKPPRQQERVTLQAYLNRRRGDAS